MQGAVSQFLIGIIFIVIGVFSLNGIILLRPYRKKRIKEEMNPKQLEKAFVEFVKECLLEYPQLNTIYCDSAEQVLIRGFKTALRNNNIAIHIENAKKYEIIDRIRFYSSMMTQLRYLILSDCVETIQAFDDAVWDDEHEDVRLDDGSTNIVRVPVG